MVKKHISKFVERTGVQCNNVIVLKLSRTLLHTEDDCLHLSTYVPRAELGIPFLSCPPALSSTQGTPTAALQKSKNVCDIGQFTELNIIS